MLHPLQLAFIEHDDSMRFCTRPDHVRVAKMEELTGWPRCTGICGAFTPATCRAKKFESA